MSDTAHYDICVIGGSSGGLAVAVGAALLGVPVAVIEPGPPGADAAAELARATLRAVADRVHAARHVPGLAAPPAIDLAAVGRHVAATIEAAAPATAPERLRALGIHLIEGRARFLGPDRIATDGHPRILTARRFVIATPDAATVPAIPGLDQVPVLTPADLLALDRLPDHLAVLGGGGEAVEWAQAYRRLGCTVTLIAEGDLLHGHDPELVDLLLVRLRAEGIRILAKTPVGHAVRNSGGISLTIGASETLATSHVLVAAGRHPEFEGLDLAAAGVEHDTDGIRVDRQLRTSNPHIFALGSGVQGAAAEAGILLRRILFRQKARFDAATLPRVVRTAPGLAEIGLAEPAARRHVTAVTILRHPLHDNDRARAEGVPHGLVKVVTDRKGRILGAGIVAPEADELIQTWQLAIAQKLKIGAIASLTAAYPTLGEASKRAAGSFFAPRLLSASTKTMVRWLAMLG